MIQAFSDKLAVLVRENEGGLESYRLQQSRLIVWVAANLIRARALERATGILGSTTMLLCTRAAHGDATAAAVLQAFGQGGGVVSIQEGGCGFGSVCRSRLV